ncbi:helix-turn-helix transcriptional regulator [Clostridium perfringens]|uniref:helix-turn-helix domain-containing protein n=1 Tax=Clostridium perfringens TaxID=1502 RepID=UPI0018AB5F34|nr:helix-turn-helix transcriptional regulator [Clostridium perfringens]EIF6297239.1 helix-turn-helix transcriptional regulator [Clostridium perfringens]MDB2070445.1 helix-turn-helix transcriptional regulator [Clostridium perfringens]
MDIGNNIKSIRKKNKLTQKDLADKLNKSVRMVQKYENSEVTPNIEVLKKISKILNVSLDSLLDTNEDNDIVTLALHNANGIDDELPEEAQKEIESFIEYIKQKYKK